MRTEGSVEINRPMEEVFRLTNDHVADWSTIVIEDHPINDDKGVGARFRTVTEENGRRMEFDGVVTRYEPPHASAVHLAGPYFDIDVEYLFEKLADSTRVMQISTVTGKGFFGVIFKVFGWMMCRSSNDALEKELANLKRFCEQTPV